MSEPEAKKGGSGVVVMRLEEGDRVASVDVVPAETGEDPVADSGESADSAEVAESDE